MKIAMCTIIAILMVMGCKRKLTPSQVELMLKKAMTQSLYKGINYDSARTKFEVQTVNYFEDKTFYECDFKVRMKHNNFDTTGEMKARISKDFSLVKRRL